MEVWNDVITRLKRWLHATADVGDAVPSEAELSWILDGLHNEGLLKPLIERDGQWRVVDTDTLDKMTDALNRASSQFAGYYHNHMAKTPPDKDKADTNAAWALICKDAAREGEALLPASPQPKEPSNG